MSDTPNLGDAADAVQQNGRVRAGNAQNGSVQELMEGGLGRTRENRAELTWRIARAGPEDGEIEPLGGRLVAKAPARGGGSPGA